MNTTETNAIEVIKLKKQFGDFVAVKEVSFTVHTGEIFGLRSTLANFMTVVCANWSRNSIADRVADDPFCSIDGFTLSFSNSSQCDGGSHNGLGFLAGGQVGLNIQSGPVVFGVEGTYSWADIKGNA